MTNQKLIKLIKVVNTDLNNSPKKEFRNVKKSAESGKHNNVKFCGMIYDIVNNDIVLVNKYLIHELNKIAATGKGTIRYSMDFDKFNEFSNRLKECMVEED